jgi:2-keto-3-deoxy-L-rhamnonate aldolase RhmA
MTSTVAFSPWINLQACLALSVERQSSWTDLGRHLHDAAADVVCHANNQSFAAVEVVDVVNDQEGIDGDHLHSHHIDPG